MRFKPIIYAAIPYILSIVGAYYSNVSDSTANVFAVSIVILGMFFFGVACGYYAREV